MNVHFRKDYCKDYSYIVSIIEKIDKQGNRDINII